MAFVVMYLKEHGRNKKKKLGKIRGSWHHQIYGRKLPSTMIFVCTETHHCIM